MERTDRELNVTGNKIINLDDPSQDQDAATKGYVDRLVQNVVWRVHNNTPLSTRDEYVHVINNKEITTNRHKIPTSPQGAADPIHLAPEVTNTAITISADRTYII